MNTTLTIKMDKRLRDEAKKTAAKLGIPLTTVMNAMLKQFVREETITVSVHPQPKASKLREWARISKEMDKGNYKAFSNVEDLIDHLGLERRR